MPEKFESEIMNEQHIVISANFTIEPMASSLKLFLDKLEIPQRVSFTAYNQIFQQLLDSSSLFHQNGQGVNAIFLRVEDLVDLKSVNYKISATELEKIALNAADLSSCVQNSVSLAVPLFVFFCPLSRQSSENDEVRATLEGIENDLAEKIRGLTNIYVFRADEIANYYAVENYDNPKGNRLGSIPYTDEYFAALGAFFARKIAVLNRRPHKVLVLDCDNTLWKGVCGEDGTDGITFEPPLVALQKFAVEQNEAGMIVCLCSKNNENDVWNVFDNRLEMPLKRSHIVSYRINWEAKSNNLKSLADELQLGLDSFVFIDDDAAVCAEVRANCPEVLTVQLPTDLNAVPNLLNHLWIFDKLKVTAEDKKRADSYRQQVSRREMQAGAVNLSDFLSSLQLMCDIAEMSPEQLPRVSQLSLRTNQFNSTTVRRSESDLQQIVGDRQNRIWTVTVSDRFGDYGLVGVVIFKFTGDECAVDSLMLSCRALGRGVEHKVVESLAAAALEANLQFLSIEFRPTDKNIPILNFLNEIGADYKDERAEKIIYRIPVESALNLTPKDRTENGAPIETKEKAASGKNKTGNEKSAGTEVYLKIAREFNSARSILRILNENKNTPRSLNRESVAARSETEQRIKNIWEKILNIRNIGVTDNFFEIGGDSLAAVGLFIEIEEHLGKSLPLSALVTFPTIAELAGIIDGEKTESQQKYLVAVQPEGTRSPLYCMHAAGGNVLFYRDLAKELGTEQPVYGLQARGVADKNETAHNQIEEMARAYLQEIRMFQPHGPYSLCGSSFGGLVAFEAAIQLQKVGETVALLALFDTYAPGYLQQNRKSVSSQSKIGLIAGKIKNAKDQVGAIETNSARLEFVLTKTAKLKMRLKRKFLWKKNELAAQYSQATGKELPKDVQRNHKAIQQALDNYQPEIYDGQMILFRAAEQPPNIIFDPHLGWDKYVTRKILTEDTPGTHGALTVYPFAAHLAEKLEPYLIQKITEEKSLFVKAA